MMAFLLGVMMAAIISLPACIPYLRRQAQNSKLFRVILVLVLMVVTVVIIAAIVESTLDVSLFGPCGIYRDTEMMAFEFSCSKVNLLTAEVFLRYLTQIYRSPICYSLDAEVCAAADAMRADLVHTDGWVWILALFFGSITGILSFYHTRDNRKQKREMG